jgi:hypothetical protein
MAHQARILSQKRFHIVLLPGFAGFDALGQLEYYGRVTPLFHDLRAPNQVLHCFDNLPTASVATPALWGKDKMFRGAVAPQLFMSNGSEARVKHLLFLVGACGKRSRFRRQPFCDKATLK